MTTATTTARDATLLDALADRLRACRAAPDGVAAPVAILWTDPEREWLPLLEALRGRMPELLVLGEYDPERRSGPAIWLRAVVDGALEAPVAAGEGSPILYLPGVARQQLRAGEECPRALQPLVELMYRGTLWLQKGGHDWTVTAFLTSPHGLGLELARDQETLDALARALRELAETPLRPLRGRRLHADDFDRLLTADLHRDLLRWMSDPAGWRARMGTERWAAFRSQARARLGFDPDVEGELTAAERLGTGEGAWAEAWARFEEAPGVYPGIPELLGRARPTTLFIDRTRWPDENEDAEARLRAALQQVQGSAHADAASRVLQLEGEHGERRGWVWARLGRAPLAAVLEPLAVLATHARSTIGGAAPAEIADTYTRGAWRADAASWHALALAPAADEPLIQAVVRALLEPWLDAGARVFQRAVEEHPLPAASRAPTVEAPEGGCLLFVDGLRYDLGQLLAERLEARGCRVRASHRWAALPTVTATAKPAVTPAAARVAGRGLPDDFAPVFTGSGRPVNAARIRAEVEALGYQVVGGELNDWPASDAARGWVEEGQIDQLGHRVEQRLPHQLTGELDRLAERILALLDAGWRAARVVTDHGWLLLPGGLPKVDLPKHLTASRWARCATVAGASQVSVPTAPWHWNPAERFATASGIACFNHSPVYAHGGISLQECLIPDLLVERVGGAEVRAGIEAVTWRGMRCVVDATATASVRADLRLGRALGASIAASVKPLDEDGRASLVVADDRHEGAEAVVVLLDEAGSILAQRATRVGESR